MIELESVEFRRDGTTLLSEVSLSFDSGVTALVGPSGAGKTTLLRVIAGLEAPDEGIVRIGGRVASEQGRVVISPVRRSIGMVFQDLALWPHLDVSENLAFGLRARGVKGKQREDAITRMLVGVGLDGKARRCMDSLSGGELQRVAIARALVLDPVALLLDEPFGNLDVRSKDELLDLVRQILRERSIPVMLVTHDPREAEKLADRIAVLEGGQLVQTGTPEELGKRPATAFVQAFVAALSVSKAE